MEFPACRTPEWLRAAFDGPQQPQVQQQQQQQQQQQGEQQQPAPAAAAAAAAGRLRCPDFVFKGFSATPRLLLSTASSTTATPSRRSSARSSSSSSSSSSRSLYEERAAAVSNSIREALFRQALFQIQNVEVQTHRSCSKPRVLASAAITYDRQQQQKLQQQQLQQAEAAAAAADSFPERLKHSAKAFLLHLRSRSSSSSSSSSLGELLRREEWYVDRCGSKRVYEVSVHRDDNDFYSLTLNPKHFADKLRRKWFHWADTNDD